MSDSDKLHFEKIGEIVGEDYLLDVGCGEGHLSQFVKRYSGIDWSKEAVLKAEKNYGKKFLNKDISEVKGSFNYASLCEVFEHLENPKEYIKKIKKIANKVIVVLPRGEFGKIVMDNDEELMKTISEHTKYHYATYEKEDIKKMFPKADFVEVDDNHLMFVV